MYNVPGLSRASTYVKGMKGAFTGKNLSSKVASGRKAASGVVHDAKNTRIAKYAMDHKGKTAAMGVAALGTTQLVSGRRGAGVSKTVGRPTGMYKY